MAKKSLSDDIEESQPLTQTSHNDHNALQSAESARDSVTSASTTSLVLEHLNGVNGDASAAKDGAFQPYSDSNGAFVIN